MELDKAILVNKLTAFLSVAIPFQLMFNNELTDNSSFLCKVVKHLITDQNFMNHKVFVAVWKLRLK